MQLSRHGWAPQNGKAEVKLRSRQARARHKEKSRVRAQEEAGRGAARSWIMLMSTSAGITSPVLILLHASRRVRIAALKGSGQ
jgi:hypothetical protein